MKRILVLETSTERGIAALVEEGKLLFSCQLPLGLQSSNYLLPELKNGLDAAGMASRDITFICLGIGPGSYTGIRVGATVAKALSFAHRIPLVGVCSLQAFAPPVKNSPFAVVIDAKIGGVYLQLGEENEGRVTYTSEPLVLPIDQAAAILSSASSIITPNAAQLISKFEAAGLPSDTRWHECYPSPLHMCALGEEQLAHGGAVMDGHLELLYMRKTQAEIEREAQNI